MTTVTSSRKLMTVPQMASGMPVTSPRLLTKMMMLKSGIEPALKQEAIQLSRLGHARVFTDPRVSPTGFPFKVANLPGTLGEPGSTITRSRVCDLGYLRHVYRKPDGSVGYRCPAEPLEDFVEKGGSPEEAEGRKCVCNSLPATVGLGQVRAGGEAELALVTAGDEFAHLDQFVPPGQDSCDAADVIRRLVG